MSNHFGIEIECFNVGSSESIVANDLNRQLKLAKASDLRQTDTWFVTDDGSIESDDTQSDYCSECGGSGIWLDSEENECDCDYCGGSGSFENSGFGAEVVSPVLEYKEESFAKVKDMYNALNRLGGAVNDTCGLHVHVDARFVNQMPLATQKKFFRFLITEYAEREDEFDARMNKDRRESNNHYCASMKQFLRFSDYDMDRYLTYGERYYKLNVHAFIRHGTVEFRHHHATMDSDEALDWIHTCVKFINDAQDKFEVLQLLEAQAAEEVAAPKKKTRKSRAKNNNLAV